MLTSRMLRGMEETRTIPTGKGVVLTISVMKDYWDDEPVIVFGNTELVYLLSPGEALSIANNLSATAKRARAQASQEPGRPHRNRPKDFSSVGGDGAVGGDPAPSGSGASEPTEEAPTVVRDPLTGRVTGTRGPVTSSGIAAERVTSNRCRLFWDRDESGEAVPVEAVWEYDVGSQGAGGSPSSPSGVGGGAGTPAAGEATVGDPVSGEGLGVSPSPGCP